MQNTAEDRPRKLNIGDEIKFASRKGVVIGYWVGKRNGNESLGY